MLSLPYRTILIAFSIMIYQRDASARKSEDMCKEYAKLVYEEEESPVPFGPRFHVVAHCAILEVPLIIGGVRAKSAEFPHTALIGFGEDGAISWDCGGSIISDSYVLTAAHCLESHDKSKKMPTGFFEHLRNSGQNWIANILSTWLDSTRKLIQQKERRIFLLRGPARKVRVGLSDLVNPEDSMQERTIVERVKHPLYRRPVKYHDIALLRLETPLQLNARVRPACLQTEHRPPGKSAIASGFGKTAYAASETSKYLMKVQLRYISEKQCKKSFGEMIGGRDMPQGLIPGVICAGAMEGGKDTCQGDSGGPLQTVMEDPYCMYSVVGLTSFGRFCGFANSPAIYTRVSYYLDWIEQIVWP